MRKIIWFIGIAIVVIAAISVVAWYLTSHTTISFILGRDSMEVTLYERKNAQDRKEITTFTEDTSLRLPKGEYILAPKSTNASRQLDTDVTRFTVGKEEETLTIKPSLALSYRNNILDRSKKDIHKAITSQFPDLMKKYSLKHEEVLGEGDWYGAMFNEKVSARDIGDTYFIVAHKTESGWSAPFAPRLVLTQANTPNVPVSILSKTNHFDLKF